MDYNKFKINEFKLGMMVDFPAIVMVAKRGSGKSWVTRDIMYHKRKIPCGMVVSPTDRESEFFRDFFPDLFIHYDFGEVFKKLIHRQRMMIEKQRAKEKQGKKIDPEAILVMDDCLARKAGWAKDESILEILMNGRHIKLTYILTMQYPLGVTPELRSNFDYIFLLNENFISNQKRIYDNYAGMFPTFETFLTAFKVCTDKHGCMVINNRINSNNIDDQVFWFKAKDHKKGEFFFGSKEFKEFHNEFYDPKYKSGMTQDGFDINTFVRKRKNVPQIKIQKV